MAYIDIITLAEAKNYLRIDDTLTDDDAQITRMINAALAYIENCTNIMLFARDKTYTMVDGFVRVYDYPINADAPDPADVEVEIKTSYVNYSFGSDTIDLVLNVGFDDPDDVPAQLKEVAFEIIDLMYYEHETGKKYTKDLTTLSTVILNSYRRFIL